MKKNKTGFISSIKNLFPSKKKSDVVVNLEEEAIVSPSRVIFKNFISNKFALLGILMLVSLFAAVFVFSAIIPLDIYHTDPVLKNISPGFGYIGAPSELEKNGIKDLDVGSSFSIGVDNNGKVYTWGKSSDGVLEIPQEVLDANIVDVAAGDRHVMAVDDAGNFYAWGNSAFDQIEIPYQHKAAIDSEKIAKVDGGDQYTAILTKENNLYVWGSVLSNGLDSVSKDYQGKIVDFQTTSYNILVLLEDGTLGTTGVRGNELSRIPENLTDGSTNVVQIAVSYRNGLALDDQGNLHTWGSTENNSLVIPNIEGDIKQLTAGRNHFAVLTEQGDVYSWGSNVYGESSVPTNLGDVESIYTNFFASYVVDTDQQITSWGLDGFVFGTDELGRNLFVRLVHGGKLTLIVAAIAVLITTLVGVSLGLIAGFYGGWIDNLIMRFAEIVSSFPFLPLAITLSALISDSMSQNARLLLIMCILGFLSFPYLARMVRGQILTEREKDFVLAAKSLGLKEKSIIIKHIFPNVINIIIVSMTLQYAGTLLTEAGLSFLGFGVIPPSPSWGNMISSAQDSEVLKVFWWRWMIPAACVLIAALSINLIGDALREAMDPKSNEK